MRTIPGFSRYKATSDGCIFSEKMGWFMSLAFDGHGYLVTRAMGDDGKMHLLSAHRAVALAYVENPHGKPCVDHIDGCRTNNHASNLRWCTVAENNGYPTACASRSNAFSSPSLRRRMRDSQPNRKRVVREDNGKIYESIADAAKDIGTSRVTIRRSAIGEQRAACGVKVSFI